ncbi:DNA replication and repair protein RecO [Cyclonatronum proteinivorum]|uniref:DNA repair protein RecO n=1 Tax=Cyclonatronum proteinivorum TaxID=1457365 RepID=A0A345UKV0_9BACT|nr:DNA repair protein RecO [Cyclonatronum proteinivorum]AXJ01102.1 DNA replication and repair protein RecO [Cyclonatronum proteinivorum]
MLAESPAIVLKAVDFKESSKIITLFTRDYGKAGVLVRGFKKAKSRFAGIMTFGSVIDAVFYYKDSRGVQTLKEAETRVSTVRIQNHFDRVAVSMAFLELVSQVIQEGEPNEELFDFCENFLKWLSAAEAEPRNLFPYLQIRVADILGVGLQPPEEWPDLSIKTEGLQALYLNILSGSLSDVPDDGLSFRLTPRQIHYFRLALNGKSAQIPHTEMPAQELKPLVYHLDVYLKHHIEGVRDRKSDAIFDQIL